MIMTGPNWPAEKKSATIAISGIPHYVVTLNNIDLVQVRRDTTYSEVCDFWLELGQMDDLITALQWAKWYLTEGKYDEQTA
jgi:hypothetical protein